MTTKPTYWRDQHTDKLLTARIPAEAVDLDIGWSCPACPDGVDREVTALDFERRMFTCDNGRGSDERTHEVPSLICQFDQAGGDSVSIRSSSGELISLIRGNPTENP